MLPLVPLANLDHLWFQAGGTLCNLTCHHCFISCSPHNRSFGFLTLAEIEPYLEEAAKLGVKEFYFTGGEPFLNPEMTAILETTLRYGPATVLTNGTVFTEAWLDRLAAAEAESPYSLEFRVSIDGFSPATNDPIRGDGTFDRAIRGTALLARKGFLPIVAAVRTWSEEHDLEMIEAILRILREAGCDRPRLKLIPTLKIGAEANRTASYLPSERVDAAMLGDFDLSRLVCHNSRLVSDRGVHVCPILLESPDSILGGSLAESLGPFPIVHGACFTCYQFGAICSNITSKE